MSMVRVVLGIGSNMDRRRHIRAGVAALRERFGEMTLSPVYESPSAGFKGPDFLNLAAIVHTDLPVDRLQKVLREIEEAEGRTRGDDSFVSRTLDIDVLLYGAMVMRANGYDIPRQEILQYDFVLKPLVDLLPEDKHPETGQTYAEHWAHLRQNHDARTLSKYEWMP